MDTLYTCSVFCNFLTVFQISVKFSSFHLPAIASLKALHKRIKKGFVAVFVRRNLALNPLEIYI